MTENRKTPKLRFKGFTDAWEQRKLGEVLRTIPFKPFLKIPEQGGKYEIIQQGNEPIIGYANGEPCEDFRNTVIFGDHTLSLYKPKQSFFVATDGVRILQGTNDMDGYYLLSLLEGNSPQSEGYKRYYSILADREVLFTENHYEQVKIGLYFKNLNNLITLHQRKLDRLKNIKKSMLDKMFPKDGEVVPEIRFKGFTDAWEQRKLGEVVTINPKTELPDEFKYVDLESVVGTNLLGFQVIKKENAPSRAQRLASYGDVFYQTVRPYQRNNYLFENVDKDMVFSTGYAQLRSKLDSYFLLTLVQNDNFVKVVLDNCTGTSYPAINGSELGKITVQIPSNEVEANQIGKVFRGIDKSITLHQRKLKHLQLQKKALLQQMFV